MNQNWKNNPRLQAIDPKKIRNHGISGGSMPGEISGNDPS